jgi:hypothetical protein
MTSSSEQSPLVLEYSTVSFVLIGPGGNHRKVIARSNHDNLDLIGLDHPALAEMSQTQQWDLSRLFGTELNTLVVHTPSDMSVVDQLRDTRTTHLTFAWKGRATTSERRKIEKVFTAMAPDIMRAISQNSTQALEWQLAGLILLCSNITSRSRQRAKILYLAAVFVAIIYVVIAAKLTFRTGGGF